MINLPPEFVPAYNECMQKREAHLAEFDFRETKSGKVLLYWKGKLIKTLSSMEASRFLDRMGQADSESARLLLAKTTGNFKRGNERTSLSSN